MVIEDYDVVKEKVLEALVKNPALWGDREIPKDIAFLMKQRLNTKPQLVEFFRDELELASDTFLTDLVSDLNLTESLTNAGAISEYTPGYR